MNIRRANSGIRMASHRLVLREFVVTDEDAVHAFAADPLVTRFTDWDPTASKTPEHSLAEATAWATNPQRAEFRQYLLGANRPRTGYCCRRSKPRPGATVEK
jgi:RimJ/RimL family protein N-acetyltransferase